MVVLVKENDGLPLAQPQAHDLNPPKYFGDMVYDISSNPLTAEGIALGRALFYDPILSLDSTISCASCHSSYTAFSPCGSCLEPWYRRHNR